MTRNRFLMSIVTVLVIGGFFYADGLRRDAIEQADEATGVAEAAQEQITSLSADLSKANSNAASEKERADALAVKLNEERAARIAAETALQNAGDKLAKHQADSQEQINTLKAELSSAVSSLEGVIMENVDFKSIAAKIDESELSVDDKTDLKIQLLKSMGNPKSLVAVLGKIGEALSN